MDRRACDNPLVRPCARNCSSRSQYCRLVPWCDGECKAVNLVAGSVVEVCSHTSSTPISSIPRRLWLEIPSFEVSLVWSCRYSSCECEFRALQCVSSADMILGTIRSALIGQDQWSASSLSPSSRPQCKCALLVQLIRHFQLIYVASFTSMARGSDGTAASPAKLMTLVERWP